MVSAVMSLRLLITIPGSVLSGPLRAMLLWSLESFEIVTEIFPYLLQSVLTQMAQSL